MGLEYLVDLFEYLQVHFMADIMTYDKNDTGGHVTGGILFQLTLICSLV